MQKQSSARNSAMLLLAIILTSAVLRSPMTALGPVLQSIRQSYSLSGALAGSLTTIPTLIFAAMALLAPLLLKRVPAPSLLFFSTALISFGVLLRLFFGAAYLFAGTVCIGIGAGLCNVLVLHTIKQHFPDRVEAYNGLYTGTLSLVSALASGLSVPLANRFGWQVSLGIWIVPTLLATLAWLPQHPFRRRPADAAASAAGSAAASDGAEPIVLTDANISAGEERSLSSMLRSSMAWKVTLCMGFQSAIYFCVIAWQPTILQMRGLTAEQAGTAQLFTQLCAMTCSFTLPRLMRRTPDQRKCIIPAALMLLVGILSYLFDLSLPLRYCFLALLGVGVGSGLCYTMTILSLRCKTPREVVSLSAMVQTGGYIIAAVGPLLLGAIYDATASFTLQIAVLAVFGLGYLFFGAIVAIRPGGNRYL